MKRLVVAKAAVGGVVAGLAVLLLSTDSAFAQNTNQPAPTNQPGCPCCHNMQSMGS